MFVVYVVVLAAAVVVAFDAVDVDVGVAAVAVAVPFETFSAGRASGTGCKVVRIAVDIFSSQISSL